MDWPSAFIVCGSSILSIAWENSFLGPGLCGVFHSQWIPGHLIPARAALVKLHACLTVECPDATPRLCTVQVGNGKHATVKIGFFSCLDLLRETDVQRYKMTQLCMRVFRQH